MNSIGEKLKSLRKESGLSLKSAGESVGLSKTHVWELENGRTKNPSLKSSKAFSNLYGVSLGFLAGNETVTLSKVNQHIICGVKGNCMQAALATLFSKELCDTVNVIDYDNDGWFDAMLSWLDKSTDFIYAGVVNAHENSTETMRALQSMYAINGFFYGVVNSKNFKGETHAVIIDRNGVVVHDPNPDKKWLGADTARNNELIYWYRFEPKNPGLAYQN